MKAKLIIFISLSLLLAMAASGCSKDEPNPEDYFTSILSGEYSKNGLWKLYVTENGTPLDNYGYVRFESKYMTEANLKFVNIIPGEATKEFKNIPITDTEEGVVFRIEYVHKKTSILITGIVNLGTMKIDLKTN